MFAGKDFTLVEFADGSVGLGANMPFGFMIIGGWMDKMEFQEFKGMVDSFDSNLGHVDIPENWTKWDKETRGEYE